MFQPLMLVMFDHQARSSATQVESARPDHKFTHGTNRLVLARQLVVWCHPNWVQVEFSGIQRFSKGCHQHPSTNGWQAPSNNLLLRSNLEAEKTLPGSRVTCTRFASPQSLSWRKRRTPLLQGWKTGLDGRNLANQLRLAVFPTIYKLFYIPSAARFQPSTEIRCKSWSSSTLIQWCIPSHAWGLGSLKIRLLDPLRLKGSPIETKPTIFVWCQWAPCFCYTTWRVPK